MYALFEEECLEKGINPVSEDLWSFAKNTTSISLSHKRPVPFMRAVQSG